MISIMMNLISS